MQHVVSQLIEKRRELAGELRHYQSMINKLTTELNALDISISLFDPNIKPKELKPIRFSTKKTTDDLIGFMKSEGISTRDQIRADAAEPDRIEQLCRNGFNAVHAKKNVLAGIDAVKSYTLHITEDSINLFREIDSYRWAKDRNGTTLDQPVKVDDHILDSVRYAIFVDEVRSVISIGSARHTASVKFAGYDGGKIGSRGFSGF